MDREGLKTDLANVGFTTATPFTTDASEVDHEQFRENLRAIEQAGGDLYIPCGNTGEYYSLSHEERIAVVETTVETVEEESTVLAGAGGSTKTVRALCAAYEDAGADAVMVMHPRHTYAHQAGLGDYYRAIAEATDLGVVIYKRSHDVPDDLLVELAGLENVVGVKYAVNDVAAFAEVTERVPGDAVTWLNGIAERFAPTYALEGADAFTTGIGNFVPTPVLDLEIAIERGDWDRARELRDRLLPIENLRAESGAGNDLAAANNVPVVKFGLDRAGLYGGPVREPLVELDDSDRERARRLIEPLV